MPACPNCGRQTLRTKDWVCQWCGYPLISRAFRPIDKTFKELQEERSLASKAAEAEQPEDELEREVETEAEAEIEMEPEPEPEPAPQPKPRTMPLPRPVFRPEPEPAPKPPAPTQPAAGSEPEIKSLPEPVDNPEQKPMVVPPGEPIILPASAAPEPKPEMKIEPEAPPQPRPEIKIEPEAPPEPPVKLESISDGMEISADQLDMLFRADKSGAHAKLSGKTVVVRGIVEKVFVRDHLDIRYIVLTGTGKKMAWSLRCTFNKEDAARLSRLNEGEAVMVRGKYDGFSKNIMFKDCVLV